MAELVYPRSTDLVVVYDVMCEARNRLLGSFNAIERDDEKVVQFALALDDRIEAIDINDIVAQQALTAAFAAERVALKRRSLGSTVG